MNPGHIVDKVCSCIFCTMIDIMWGDPGLNAWEFGFVESVARYGWLADYTDPQKSKILQVFTKRRKEVLKT